MTLKITSKAFANSETIPRQYTGEGADVSPALVWEGVPEGTAELALICDDPDAPTPTPWVHWVLYKIPADCPGLAEGENGGGVEGNTSWGAPGYRGPMPPPGHGVHRYFIKIFALEKEVELGPGATKEALLDAIQKHVMTKAELVGTYERK